MKKKYSLSLLGFILLLVLPLEKGRCASYVVCASGNWSTPATFKVGVGCPGGASAPAQPLAADDIIVSSGTLTIDAAATPTCHNITINAGAILTFAVSSGLTFNITGTLTIIGSLTFPAGYAGIVNVTGNIVNSGTVSRTNLTNGTGTINLTGSLSQSAGSFSLFATAARNLDLVFTGAGNVTVTSTGGTFTISDIGINKSTKATVVDIQSDAFITGINTAAVFNFTLTTGTLKINNGAAGGTALTNMHNGAGAAALTIPYNVVLESDASTTTTLSKSGQTTLNGELFINGGTVNHSTTSKKDLIYVEAGAGNIPELNVSSGTLSLAAGFNDGTTTGDPEPIGTNPVIFNMSGGTILINTGGTNTGLGESFGLSNVAGGQTIMSNGTIVFQNSSSNAVDMDFGSTNIGAMNSANYNVSGGTVQFGNASSTASWAYTFVGWPSTNYPNVVIDGSGAFSQKLQLVAGPKNFQFLSLTIKTNTTFDTEDYFSGGASNTLTLTGADASGNAFYNAGAFTCRTGIVEFNSTSAQKIDGTLTTAFYDMTMKNTGVVTLVHSATAHTLTLNAIAGAVNFTHSAGIDLTTTSDVTINQPTAAVTSSWNINAGTATVGGKLIYAGSSATNIAETSVTTGSLTVTGVASFAATNTTAASQLLNVTTGSITFSSLFTLGTAGGTSGTLAVTGTGTINFNAAPAFTYDNTNSPAFTTVSGSTLNFNGNITGTGAGTLTFNSGSNSIFTASASVTPGTTTLTFGNLQINAAKTVTAAGSFNVSGNWTNLGTAFTPGLNSVTFNGGGAQSINGPTSTTFYNLIIKNTSGVATGVTQNIATQVSHVMTLTTGSYKLNGFILTLQSSATTAISAGSATTYVISEDAGANTSILQWNIGAAAAGNSFIFPFGYSGSYIPFTFAVTTAGAAATTVGLETYHTASNAPLPSGVPAATGMNGLATNSASCNPGAATTILAVNRFWQITVGGTTPIANLTFSYLGAENTVSAACGTNLSAQHWDAANAWWGTLIGGTATMGVVYPGGGAAGVTGAGTGTVSATGADAFSPWVLVSTTNPLPVDLLSFNAVLNSQKQVDITWTTATETNCDYYIVERTGDGATYETVGKVKGAGNSSEQLHYLLCDKKPYDGVSYYRLKQFDFNGQSKIYAPVGINIQSSAAMEIFPNPSHGETLNMKLSGSEFVNKEVLIVVYDMQGRQSFSKVILTGQSGDIIHAIDPENGLAPGVYLITASSDNAIYKQKVIISP